MSAETIPIRQRILEIIGLRVQLKPELKDEMAKYEEKTRRLTSIRDVALLQDMKNALNACLEREMEERHMHVELSEWRQEKLDGKKRIFWHKTAQQVHPRETPFTFENMVDVSELIMPRSGIYFLLYKGKVVYIGQTEYLARRIPQHVWDKEFDKVLFWACSIQQAIDQEKKLICRYKPRYNYPYDRLHKEQEAISLEELGYEL